MVLDPEEATRTLKNLLRYYRWFYNVALEGDATKSWLVVLTRPGLNVDKGAVPTYWKGYSVVQRAASKPRTVAF